MAKQTFTTGQVLTAAQMTSLQQTAMGGGSATAKTASYVLVAADAGTTVIMNSASATTITVNTSLFSAGDTVFIQNIGAGVSTITAGTATVNTASSLALAQYESGNLYFTAAGASIFSKADGAGAGGGSGLTLVQRSSFTSVADTGSTFDNVFTTTYKSYVVVLENIFAASSGDDLQIQGRYTGPNTQAATYYGYSTGIDAGGNNQSTASSNTAQLTLSDFNGSSAVAPISGQVFFHNVGNGSQTFGVVGQLVSISAGVGYTVFGINSTARNAYIGFLLKSASSNITGTVSVYGLATA
jgi:hypothetical protein